MPQFGSGYRTNTQGLTVSFAGPLLLTPRACQTFGYLGTDGFAKIS
jgi:hypothetical protein